MTSRPCGTSAGRSIETCSENCSSSSPFFSLRFPSRVRPRARSPSTRCAGPTGSLLIDGRMPRSPGCGRCGSQLASTGGYGGRFSPAPSPSRWGPRRCDRWPMSSPAGLRRLTTNWRQPGTSAGSGEARSWPGFPRRCGRSSGPLSSSTGSPPSGGPAFTRLPSASRSRISIWGPGWLRLRRLWPRRRRPAVSTLQRPDSARETSANLSRRRSASPPSIASAALIRPSTRSTA